MRPNSTRLSGATAMRALFATALVLLLVGACATDDGGAPPAPQVTEGTGGGAAAEPASTEPEAEEKSTTQMTPALRAAYMLARQRGASEEYTVDWDGAALVADNPGQGFGLAFGDERIEVLPSRGEWTLGLQVTGYGCVDAVEPVDSEPPTLNDQQLNEVRQDHGPLEAWYLNGPLGLEQGFEVYEAPACDGRLRIEVEVDGLTPTLGTREQVVLRGPTGEQKMQVDSLYVVDAEGTELVAELGVDRGTLLVDVHASEAVFPLSIDPVWSQQAKLIASDAAGGAQFGISVSVSGDTAVVGALFQAPAGAAYIFTRSGGTWSEEQKLVASDGATGDGFGVSVGISGDTVVVGSWQDDDLGSSSGSAYIFVRNGGVWSEQQKITALDGAPGDIFGRAVSVSNDTVAVGADGVDDGGGSAGAAYVFLRTGTAWTQQAKLIAADGQAGDQLGFSINVDNDTVVAGALRDDDGGSNAGAVYVFVRSLGTWAEQQKLTASDAADDDAFGHSVGVSGDTLVVGANTDDDGGLNTGSAYVFTRNATTWTEAQKLTASDADPGALFGHSVSIDGDAIAIGSVNDDGLANEAGATYIFLRSGASWGSETKLTAQDAEPGDRLGYSVSVSADTLVAGAYLDDDGGTNAGSAYVFTFTNTGDACTQDTDCTSGFCVDGVCCAAACGGNDPSDCQACAAALTGGTDGTCAPITVGTTCRAATGACDVAEACDGTATACPADSFEPAGTSCGDPASTACTAPDSCDGAGTCLANHAAAGAPCGDQNVTCAVDDACDGAGTCTDNGFEPASTVCRASNGVCDVAETCTGNSAGCPADAFEPATTVCRAATDLCDLPETCTGTGEACPADAVAPPTTTCRASTGSCDPAELCDGAVKACPTDLLASAGDVGSPSCAPYLCDGTGATCASTCLLDTDCAAGNYCDAGTCTTELVQGAACTADNQCGTGFCVDGVCCDAACGGDDAADCQACTAALTGGTDGTCAPISAGTECRASAGSCDPAETCDGTATACPADTLESAGTECRAAAGDCDVAEQCDGATPTCPEDLLEAAGTTCREAAGDCDVEEQCDGAAIDCPADETAADGSTCDDGDTCTEGDVCTDGACTPGDDVCGTGGSSATGGAGGTPSIPAAPPAPEADGGCSCRVAGAPQDHHDAPARGLAGLLLVGLAAARRRRRLEAR